MERHLKRAGSEASIEADGDAPATQSVGARLRWPLIIATMLGLAAALWALGREGWGEVLASAMRTGLGGFDDLIPVGSAEGDYFFSDIGHR